jgi:hypothetical protein
MATGERSILGDMALQFVEKREVLATAGLGHFLKGSPIARESLLHLLAEHGIDLPRDLAYRNEDVVHGAEGRPDIVGVAESRRYLIREGKFWASLTDAQPIRYLESLAPEGCLLFIAPGKRAETLWAELQRRCEQAGWPLPERAQGSDLRLGKVQDSWWLGVVSWRHLLEAIRRALEDGRDSRRVADVDQLASLCEMEDDEAFLPLTSMDLSQPTPMRLYQFMDLVRKVKQHGLGTGLFQPSTLKTGGTIGQYVQYIAAGDYQIAVFVDLKRWARQRMTPLWLEVAVDPGHTLGYLEVERPPRVFYDGSAGRPVVPLTLQLHAEEDAVVADIINQISDVLEHIRGRPPTVALNAAAPLAGTSGIEETGVSLDVDMSSTN